MRRQGGCALAPLLSSGTTSKQNKKAVLCGKSRERPGSAPAPPSPRWRWRGARREVDKGVGTRARTAAAGRRPTALAVWQGEARETGRDGRRCGASARAGQAAAAAATAAASERGAGEGEAGEGGADSPACFADELLLADADRGVPLVGLASAKAAPHLPVPNQNVRNMPAAPRRSLPHGWAGARTLGRSIRAPGSICPKDTKQAGIPASHP